MTRTLTLLLAVLLCGALQADLFQTLAGKPEAEVVAEFEAGIPAMLQARAATAEKPQIRAEINKRVLELELKEVKDSDTVWSELVNYAWAADKLEYAKRPGPTTHTLKVSALTPAQITGIYAPERRTNVEVAALAAWLAARKDLMAANAQMAMLAQRSTELRGPIEEWLVAKHGWKQPESGLTVVQTHDFHTRRDGVLLLTTEAAEQRIRLLEREAKETLKELTAMQGGDLRGKPGQRKKSPTVRLDVLAERVARFPKAYAGTPTSGNRQALKTLADITEAVAADLKWIEETGHRADRMAIDGDAVGGANLWAQILKANPEDVQLIQKVADITTKAASIRDNGRTCEHKDLALRAAQMFEKLQSIYPLWLSGYNYGGVNYMAAGEKAKARAQFEEVLRRTEGPGISDTEKQNREYAENRLKELK